MIKYSSSHVLYKKQVFYKVREGNNMRASAVSLSQVQFSANKKNKKLKKGVIPKVIVGAAILTTGVAYATQRGKGGFVDRCFDALQPVKVVALDFASKALGFVSSGLERFSKWLGSRK